ncbi:12192_t:CDS:2, partial [Dentiscutata heterogama]
AFALTAGKKRRRKTPPEPTCKGSMGKNKKKAKTTDLVEKENQEKPIQKTPPHSISSQSENDKTCQKDVTSTALTWDDKVEQDLQVLKDCTEENTEEEHIPTRISSEIAEVNKETSKQRHVLNDDCAENTDISLEEKEGSEDSKRILSPDMKTESTEIQEVSK